MEQVRSYQSERWKFWYFLKDSSNLLEPREEDIFSCYNRKVIRLMTRISLGLKHLRENKINHNFQNCINPFCNCGMDIESTSHFFLQCS